MCVPVQDSLLPFEKRTLELTFAPKFVPAGSGWDHFQATPTRRDYTLYLRFMAVETNREGKCMSECHYTLYICVQATTLQQHVCVYMYTSCICTMYNVYMYVYSSHVYCAWHIHVDCEY